MSRKYFLILVLLFSLNPACADEKRKISILGEVSSPGAYELAEEQNVYDAIAKAGGFSNIANRKHIKIVRKLEGSKKKSIGLDFSKDILALKDGDETNLENEVYQIKDGDLLYVGKSRVRQAGQIFMSALKIVSLGAMTGAISGAVN